MIPVTLLVVTVAVLLTDSMPTWYPSVALAVLAIDEFVYQLRKK